MEYWDIYDAEKRPTGRTMKRNDWCLKDGEYHLTVLGVVARPDGTYLREFFEKVKEKYPDQKFMADCSTVEEALFADEIGFDFIGTTLVGYTPYSVNDRIEQNDFEIIRKILKQVHHPVIAEGNIDVPQKARRVIELGCYSVVVGGAITRPQLITKKFTNALTEGGE